MEEPQAPLPDYILHSTLCHAFTKTHCSPQHPLHWPSLIFKSHLLSLANATLLPPSFISPFSFHPSIRCQIWAMVSWFRFHYNTTAHVSASSPSCSCLLCLLQVDSSTSQDKKLILEFCPWFPPFSPWAVNCQHWPPMGAPRCCNYLWHPGSGACTQVTCWRGLLHRAEGRKGREGRFSLCSRQLLIWLLLQESGWNYRAFLVPALKKAISLKQLLQSLII